MAETATSEAVLRADELVKHFDGVRALQGVSIGLAPGEILGLIGPNGSGKTTLLNCLSGAITPTSGRLEINGIDCAGSSSYRIAQLGVARTFQNIRLFPSLLPCENVEVAMRTVRGGKTRAARALEILDEMDLSELAYRPVNGLPYGLQRRLEIARAIASEPSYLLLDEPAAGMNDKETGELMDLLFRGVERWKCGILIIDHDLPLIMKLCARIQVLNEGRTIAVGSPQQVQNNPEVISAYLGKPPSDSDTGP